MFATCPECSGGDTSPPLSCSGYIKPPRLESWPRTTPHNHHEHVEQPQFGRVGLWPSPQPEDSGDPRRPVAALQGLSNSGNCLGRALVVCWCCLEAAKPSELPLAAVFNLSGEPRPPPKLASSTAASSVHLSPSHGYGQVRREPRFQSIPLA